MAARVVKDMLQSSEMPGENRSMESVVPGVNAAQVHKMVYYH